MEDARFPCLLSFVNSHFPPIATFLNWLSALLITAERLALVLTPCTTTAFALETMVADGVGCDCGVADFLLGFLGGLGLHLGLGSELDLSPLPYSKTPHRRMSSFGSFSEPYWFRFQHC
jgi:hypothetical protein